MKRWVCFCISVFLMFSCVSMHAFAKNAQTQTTEDVVETTEFLDETSGKVNSDSFTETDGLDEDSSYEEQTNHDNGNEDITDESMSQTNDLDEGTTVTDGVTVSDQTNQSEPKKDSESESQNVLTDDVKDDPYQNETNSTDSEMDSNSLNAEKDITVESSSQSNAPVLNGELSLLTMDEPQYYTEEPSIRMSDVYVNANVTNGDGTEANPVNTINEALSLLQSGGTIHLLSDIAQDELIFLDGVSVTINGNGHTIKRANNFNQGIDMARGAYHPALIEVANGSVLTLKNVTLDDNYHAAAQQFLEQETGDGYKGNENKVQDAMIALYDGHKHSGQIILDDGTTIQNYGGMSAIRVTAQYDKTPADKYQLIMKAGSQIYDDHTYVMGTARGYGAIWAQGGRVLIEEDALLQQLHGNVIYAEDGAIIDCNGHITQDYIAPMWLWNYSPDNDPNDPKKGGANNNGHALISLVGGETRFNLGNTGVIDSINLYSGYVVNPEANVLIHNRGGQIEISEGSKISLVSNGGILDADGGRYTFAGSIDQCNGSKNVLFRLRGAGGTFTLSETGEITNCDTKDVGIFYDQAQQIVINGLIENCTGLAGDGIIYLSGLTPGAQLTINESAVIQNNTVDDGYVIKMSNKSTVTLNGGKIIDNDCAAIRLKGDPALPVNNTVNLISGEIARNGDAEQIVFQQNRAYSRNNTVYVDLHEGVVLDQKEIRFDYGSVTLLDGYAIAKVGYPGSTVVEKIKQYQQTNSNEYSGMLSQNGLWVQPSNDSIALEVHFDNAFQSALPLFAAYVQLDEKGNPIDNVNTVSCTRLDDHTIQFEIEGVSLNTSYGVMWLYGSQYQVSPTSISIYTGGTQSGDKYCDIGEGADCTGGLPIDHYTLDGLPTSGEFKVDNETPVSFNSKIELERLLKQYTTISYLDENGNSIVNDETAGQYVARISIEDGHTLQVKESDSSAFNPIMFVDGTLIIRYIESVEEAQSGAIMYKALKSDEAPTETDTIRNPLLVYDASTDFYTNNNDALIYPDDEAYREGIALLDDDLLDGNDNRQQHLENKANEVLTQNGVDLNGKSVQYEFHYLDLVDTNNANAWVASSKDVDVYLPYPNGLTSDSEFHILHFKDLHREYGIAGEENVIEAINNSEVEVVPYKSNENWIKFSIPRSGFSPFLIVWTTDKPSDQPQVDQPEETDHPGTWDDGGPFTSDECGSVYDRWGNLIYQGVCGVTTSYQLVNTSDK